MRAAGEAGAGTIVARFEAAGFDVVACKMGRLSPALLREHYAHVASKPFYPEIEAFMSRRPVVLVALQGENVVIPPSLACTSYWQVDLFHVM